MGFQPMRSKAFQALVSGIHGQDAHGTHGLEAYATRNLRRFDPCPRRKMSTYYATFADHQRAKDALRELLRGGVRPDDASLLLPGDTVADTQDISSGGTVGDASYLVGRSDDPAGPAYREDPTVEMTTIEASRISGVDTSDRAFTGDSVDQMDDSQDVAEDMIYPRRGISQGEHEMDDLAMAVTTGLPTPIPEIDDIRDGDEMQDQNEEGLEALDVPGFGAALGNGALATAALGEGSVEPRLKAFFDDDGVPVETGEELLAALRDGDALLAIVATPGEIDEPTVEAIAARNGGTDRGLFDAPRFYDNDVYTS